MLVGRRVTLRSIEKQDLHALCTFKNNFEVMIANGGSPPTPQALERFAADFDALQRRGETDSISFVIEVEGKVIGVCRLAGLSESRGVARNADIAILIGEKEQWSQGLGREAIRLLLGYAFKCWNLNRVGIRTNSRNARALRCYKACGFIEEGRLREKEWNDGEYIDTVCLSILRKEWQLKQQLSTP